MTDVALPDNDVNTILVDAVDYDVEVLFILILMLTFPQDICSSNNHLNELFSDHIVYAQLLVIPIPGRHHPLPLHV